MTTFSNTPPKDPRGVPLPLIRTPAQRPLRAIVTSTDLVGTFTHYWKGRTLPCDDDKCLACKDGSPFRWHAWLSAYTGNGHQHILFEMTARPCEDFVLYRKAHGGLRGCLFDAWRPSHRPNGRVLVKVAPANLTGLVLPDPPNLLNILSMIWNVPLPAISVRGVLEDVAHLAVTHDETPITPPGPGNGRERR
jgi:hypothetical protein